MCKVFFRYLLFPILLICVTPTRLLPSHKKSSKNTITYKLQGAFETELQSYFKAKVLALTFNYPLLYKKGIYFDQLAMDIEEKPYSSKKENKFKKIVNLDTKKKIEALLNSKEDDSTLYIVDAFFPSKMFNPNEIKKNRELREQLKQMIRPRFQLQDVYRPTQYTTVAVYVRNDIFTTNQFYTDQIKKISSLFYDKPLYVHVFTNNPQPTVLVEQYKNVINQPNITFACRPQTKDSDILEDFFSIDVNTLFLKVTHEVFYLHQL